jgi:uncharacterized membrane protein YbaN (DUF454 family)
MKSRISAILLITLAILVSLWFFGGVGWLGAVMVGIVLFAYFTTDPPPPFEPDDKDEDK